MKKGLLTTVALSAGILALSACGGGSSGGGGAGGEMKSLSITNKEALQASFRVGDSPRTIAITSDPVINVREKIASGDLVFKSNNLEVVSTVGAAISAVGTGTTTVEAIYKKKSFDSVEITVSGALTPQEKYGITHAGTEEDPLDNTDALKVGEWSKNNSFAASSETFYIKGIVDTFYHAPGSRTDGLVSWYLQKASTDAQRFEVYKATKEDGTLLTNDDIWVGAEVLAKAQIYYYNDGKQAETSGTTHFVRITGGAPKPSPRTTVQATFAQALSAGAALADGADTYDYYQFDAYVSAKEGSNYFLTATQGEELVSATSDADHQSRSYYSNAIEIYNPTDSALIAKLKKNAKVTVKMVIKNYHGQVENLLALTADDVTVVTEGEEWSYEQLTVAQARTKISAIDISGVTKDKSTLYAEDGKSYQVTGTVTKKGTWSSQHNNGDFYIADTAGDQTNTLQVFRVADQTLFDSLVVDTTVVKVTCQLAAFVRVSEGTPSLSAYETNANPTVEVVGSERPELTGITLNKNTAYVEQGGTLQLTVSPVPSNAELPAVTWAVIKKAGDESNFIEVDGGVVTVTADATVGYSATIEASCVGYDPATCVITVIASGSVEPEWDTTGFEVTEIAELPFPAGNAKSTEEYTIVGTLGAITSTQYGNSTISDKAGTTSITVYGMYDLTGTLRYDAMTNKPVEGDVVVLKGVIQNFKNKDNVETKEIINAKVLQINGVKETLPGLTGITLNETTAEVKQGRTLQLTVSPVPAQAELGSILWGVEHDTTDGKIDVVDGLVSVASDATVGGTATIKASNGEFTASCVITVVAGSAVVKQTVTKNISEISGTTKDGIKVSNMTMDSVISLAASTSGNNGKVYSSGAEWRFYQSDSGTLTVSAKDATIVSVTITFSVKNTCALLYNSNSVTSGTAVSVNAQSALFTLGNTGSATNGQVKITAISVTYLA